MSTELLDNTLTWIAANPGWMGLIVFLTALSESLAILGMIVPGALMMFGFGALIALGHMEFWTACAWAVAGAIAGDGLSFWLGRAFHQRLRQLWPFSRHPETLARSEAFFERHGGKSVLFGRFFGPVRAVIPAVAGMLDMPTGRFFLVNICSALLWAPAYLLPGMAFGASLHLASRVAWRLVVLMLVLVILLWLTVRLVRGLFKLLHPHVNDWLQMFAHWSRGRPLIGSISASLLDPEQGEWRGLCILAVLLVGGGLLLGALFYAGGHHVPTAVDQSLYHFLRDLRTPWADDLMVFVTELADYQVILPFTLTLFLWLYWRRNTSAALHWLAAVGFGLAIVTLFKWIFQISRPVDIQGIADLSFPSNHATISTLLFGFIAVLVARETTPAQRWLVYLGAALLIIPIAFSRLYLGVHWLTDTVGGLSLGLVWVTLLGLAYNRHPAPPLSRAGLLLVSLVALTVFGSLHSALDHQRDLHRYRPRVTSQTLDQAEWWENGWRRLPAYRIDFRGQHKQRLTLQWASPRQALARRLSEAGWEPAPSLGMETALMWLNPAAQLSELPVLPRVHDGRHENITLVHSGDTPDTRWVLRFWDMGFRLRPGEIPLWLGNLDFQGLERRMNYLTLTRPLPASSTPRRLLEPALRGLSTRTVGDSADSTEILLIDHASPRPSTLRR
jgi:undecaprenyl-diphosphatase